MGHHSAIRAATALSPEYVNAIRSTALLSHEEEIDLARRWLHQRDEGAKAKLLTAHLRLVVKIANTFSGYNVLFDDLVAEGTTGLTRALDKYDPERGLRFSTYAMWWIRAAMQDVAIRSASLVKMGTTPEEKTLFFRLRQSKARLGFYEATELPAEIITQIANDLGVAEKHVVDMNRRLGGDASLDAPANDGRDAESIIGLFQSPEPRPDEVMLDRERARIFSELAELGLADLKPRERDILTRRTLSEEPLSLDQLGTEYGVTRERIRQLEKKALAKFTDRVREEAAKTASLTGFHPAEQGSALPERKSFAGRLAYRRRAGR